MNNTKDERTYPTEISKDVYIALLEKAMDELGTDITASTLCFLLRMPSTGSIPMSQVTKLSRLTAGGVSRLVGGLAGFRKDNRREYKAPLLSIHDDPSDRRYKTIALTDYGKQTVKNLAYLQ